MIKVYDDSEKMTANEFARYIVADKGQAAHYWSESVDNIEKFTDKEINDINIAIDKQINRVNKFLGVSKLMDKVFK